MTLVPDSNELRKHIWHSLGLNHVYRGQQRGAKGKNEDASTDYNEAIGYYRQVIEDDPQYVEAFDNMGNTYIELAKISPDNKKKQLEYIDNAIKCYDDAIKKRVERARQWWATFHFDKARALALSIDEDDKRKDLDEVVEEVEKELNKTIDAVVPEPVGFDDLNTVFQDFKNVKAYDKINRLLECLREVILQARLKGD